MTSYCAAQHPKGRCALQGFGADHAPDGHSPLDNERAALRAISEVRSCRETFCGVVCAAYWWLLQPRPLLQPLLQRIASLARLHTRIGS